MLSKVTGVIDKYNYKAQGIASHAHHTVEHYALHSWWSQRKLLTPAEPCILAADQLAWIMANLLPWNHLQSLV